MKLSLTLRHRIETVLFKLLLYITEQLQPIEVIQLGRWFGKVLFISGVRRKVVDRNLELVFKDKTPIEIHALSLSCYQNMSTCFFEFLKLHSTPPELLAQWIELDNAEELHQAILEDKGVVLTASHFGHWELLSASICQLIKPFYGYAGKQSNPQVDRLINQIRTKFGMHTIGKSTNSNRAMLKALKNGNLLGIIGDLNVPHQNLFVDFFGIKAAAGIGLGRFIKTTKCPLFFAWITRKQDFQHVAHFKRLHYTLSGDAEKDISMLTQMYFSELENQIKINPDHYFWFNRRFKTRPESEAGINLYEKMD